jgi:segregation and condensation protein A
MAYQIQLDQFSGPFHLLLSLIEEKKLDISKIALSKVTDDFLAYLEKNKDLDLNELADFLVIAAKLLFIKSNLILPEPIEDESQEQNLENQLKIYREYYQAAKLINKIFNKRNIALARLRPHSSVRTEKSIKITIKPATLKEIFNNAIKYLLEMQQLPQRALKRVISLQEKVNAVLERLKKCRELNFRNLIEGQSRIEIVVNFLAILELAKERAVLIEQRELFEEIIIKKL